MGTRSTIALEFADGSVSQVYCHWDGYLEGVGAQLVSDYSDPFDLQELIDGGDMSSIGQPYTARGEELNIRRYQDIDEYFDDCQQEEFDYILRCIDGQAVWFVRCWGTSGTWITMDEAKETKFDQMEENDYE
jgi:hypothetical protein